MRKICFIGLFATLNLATKNETFSRQKREVNPIATIPAIAQIYGILSWTTGASLINSEESKSLEEIKLILAQQTGLLSKIDTSITSSMSEFITSNKEQGYKEMLLLVEYYTKDLILETVNFQEKLKAKQADLKLSLHDWYDAEDVTKTDMIDFNIRKFVRHSRLWKDHIFQRTDLSQLEVQRQVLMFVTMYTFIDQDLFDFLPVETANREWEKYSTRKEAFMKDMISSFSDRVKCTRLETINKRPDACRNSFGEKPCSQCINYGVNAGSDQEYAYTIRIKTSNRYWAGTDDVVQIKIYGSKCVSSWINLSKKDDFKRGRIDEFQINHTDFGAVEKVQLRKSADRDDWRVDGVKITLNGETASFNFHGASITYNTVTRSNSRLHKTTNTISTTGSKTTIKSTTTTTLPTTTTHKPVTLPLPIKADLLAIWSIFEDPLTYSMGINFSGGTSQIISSELENVTAFGRCSFIFEDKYYILARVDNCKLSRVGTLNVDLYDATCTTTKGGSIIVACFALDSYMQYTDCFKTTDPFGNLTQIGSSRYNHQESYISASDELIFVVGKYFEFAFESTETMKVNTWKWQVRKSYPYDKQIYRARSLYYDDKFIVFGGMTSKRESKLITAFVPASNSWQTLGNLKSKRADIAVIEINDKFLVIGGNSQGEICWINHGEIVCSYQETTIPSEARLIRLIRQGYYYHLFPITAGYCIN